MVFLLSCDIYVLIKGLCLFGFFYDHDAFPNRRALCQKWCAQWLFCNFQTNKANF
jgi:hypothetical protein